MTKANKPYVIVVGADYSETWELAFDKALALAARPRPAGARPQRDAARFADVRAGIGRGTPHSAVIEAASRLSSLEKHCTNFARLAATSAGLRVVPHLRTDSPPSRWLSSPRTWRPTSSSSGRTVAAPWRDAGLRSQSSP